MHQHIVGTCENALKYRQKSFNICKHESKYLYNCYPNESDYVNMRQLWAREARIQCFSRYSYPERWSFAREKMMKLCLDGKLKEIKTTAIGFENTPQALRDMLSGKALGKMIVKYSEAVG